MEMVDDVGMALLKVMEANNMRADYGQLRDWLKGIAHEVVTKYPGQVGPQGTPGMTGAQGPKGRDAYDKYLMDFSETLVKMSWKGIDFEAPFPADQVHLLPEGPLTYGDVGFLSTVCGQKVIDRIALFWRREYDAVMDKALFLNKEDLCHLSNTNKSSSYPARLPDC